MANDQPTPSPTFRQQMTPGLPTGNMKDYLISKGWPEDQAERAAQKAAAQMLVAPQDWIGWVSLGLKTAIPFLVARYVPGGGGLVQAGKQILTNIAGQAAIGGAEQAIRTGQPSQFVGGAAQSGLFGIPGAVTQAAVGAATLPRKATVRTQRAIEDFQKGLSPEVGRVLDRAKPKDLYSAATPDRMMAIAGKKLDAMEAAIEKGVGEARFAVSKSGKSQEPTLFGPSGTPIRDPALRQMLTGAQRGSPVHPAGEGRPFSEIRDEIKTLRTGAYETAHAKMEAKRSAKQLEDQLLADMRRKGFSGLADQYQQALLTHAKDMVGIRGIKWVQAQQRRPGGASPVDDPELSQAMDHLASKGFGQEARLMLAGLFAAMRHPFLAAGETIQAAKQMGKVVDVNRIKGPLTPTPLRQLAPPAAGAAVQGVFGRPQPPPDNPAIDDLTRVEQDLGATDVHVGELDQLIKELQ